MADHKLSLTHDGPPANAAEDMEIAIDAMKHPKHWLCECWDPNDPESSPQPYCFRCGGNGSGWSSDWAGARERYVKRHSKA